MKFGDSVPTSIIIISNCILYCVTAHCGLANLGSRSQELLHTVGRSSEIIPQFYSAGDVQADSAVSVTMLIIPHGSLELVLPFQMNLHLMDLLLPGPQLQPGWSPFCFPGLDFLKVSHTDVWSRLCLACFIQHNDLQLC